MQIKSAEFVTSAGSVDGCPAWQHPEFAFIGRSNVGKSSLINLLAGRHTLAKVSGTPGKTRLLNFFLINHQWSLVDLPGYGFAKTTRAEKATFNRLVADYITSRLNLRKVFVLIDSRHEPQAIDLDFVAWQAATGVPFELVMTKVDKVSRSKAAAHEQAFVAAMAELGLPPPPVSHCSAKSRAGRQELLGRIRLGMDS